MNFISFLIQPNHNALLLTKIHSLHLGSLFVLHILRVFATTVTEYGFTALVVSWAPPVHLSVPWNVAATDPSLSP